MIEVSVRGREGDALQGKKQPGTSRKTVTSEVVNAKGDVLYRLENVEAPESWSQNAIDIAVNKYFRKAGIPKSILPEGKETSIDQMVARVLAHLCGASLASGYFSSEGEAEAHFEQLREIILSQSASFNSPVWFNCGLHSSYQIYAKSENFRWDSNSKQVVSVENAYEFPQTSACFIQSVKDELGDIFGLVKKEAKIFKFGSGTGTNFSAIRSKHESLAGGGESSGLLSFLEVLDKGASATKSGGITRRAAKMVTLDADHPEIFDFVSWKVREEKKAKALIAAGYDASLDGEAYASVSGQNSNNSVRLSDSFFKALAAEGLWQTKARTDGRVIEEFPARELWDHIAAAAWGCADPGLQFSDTIEKWNTCQASASIRGSNPCSEYMFLDETACNLASLNLVNFLDSKSKAFDWDEFEETAEKLFIAQDVLIELSSYPTPEIAKNSYEFRPLGLGVTNLGALLMRLGLPYGEGFSLDFTRYLMSRMQVKALETSVLMAEKMGAFDQFGENKESFLRVMNLHREANAQAATLEPQGDSVVPLDWSVLGDRWDRVLRKVESVGARNSQLSLIAPTGTIGLMMDCDTLGIEPEFSMTKTKTLAGGGQMILVNKSVQPALMAMGLASAEIESCMKELEMTGSLQGSSHLNDAQKRVFRCAVPSQRGEPTIAPSAHLAMMAAAQPFLSGAISKTVNLPAETTPADIQEIFLEAWRLGLKSVAIYRDGSKGAQPLDRPSVDEIIRKDFQ